MDEIFTLFEKVWGMLLESIKDHFLDWAVTAVITFFTVKKASRQYYHGIRKKVAKNIMERGLLSMFNLNYSEPLPTTAKAIFVEYGKSSIFFSNRQLHGSLCKRRGLHDVRKTVTFCGNSQMEVSAYRPVDYGVLGAANIIQKPLLFDFQHGKLMAFSATGIERLEVVVKDGCFYHKEHELSRNNNQRAVMIAVPIIEGFSGSKRLGGITFDIEPSDKTIYQEIQPEDDENTKARKNRDNKKVFEVAVTTADYLKTAYFQIMEVD